MKVLLRAPLLTNSGYGVHSRQVFEWLEEKENIDLTVECLNWGQTPWLINPSLEDGLIGKIMSRAQKPTGTFDLSIQIQLPDEWNSSLANKNIGISAFVETDRCNPAWVEACNKMDLIITPSEFTRKVAKRSGILMTPVIVVPEWFNENVVKENIDDNKILKDKRMNLKHDFNFLIISQLTAANPQDDRKNIYNAIKWTLEEFETEKDVGIVLKTNMGKGSTIDRKITLKTIKQMLNSFNSKNKNKRINLIHGNMSSKEIACLYKHEKIKVIVSPTRGEGYGLPLVDAAAVGMPVVATGKTGHLDFLTIKGNPYFLPVTSNLIAIPKTKIDNRIFFEGFQWHDPDEISFKQQIRKVFLDYDNIKKESDILKHHVNENFSKENIKKIYDKVIFGELNND
jgi:glycosyltransferase involved in cell wall biosynthesis